MKDKISEETLFYLKNNDPDRYFRIKEFIAPEIFQRFVEDVIPNIKLLSLLMELIERL